jgi:hypothetical protein
MANDMTWSMDLTIDGFYNKGDIERDFGVTEAGYCMDLMKRNPKLLSSFSQDIHNAFSPFVGENVEVSTMDDKPALLNYVKNMHLKEPVQLELSIEKFANQNMTRYMRAYINNRDVTGMVADLGDFKKSKARDTMGCMIVHGIGMDMYFKVQNDIAYEAEKYGFKNMFHDQHYRLHEYCKKRNMEEENSKDRKIFDVDMPYVYEGREKTVNDDNSVSYDRYVHITLMNLTHKADVVDHMGNPSTVNEQITISGRYYPDSVDEHGDFVGNMTLHAELTEENCKKLAAVMVTNQFKDLGFALNERSEKIFQSFVLSRSMPNQEQKRTVEFVPYQKPTEKEKDPKNKGRKD